MEKPRELGTDRHLVKAETFRRQRTLRDATPFGKWLFQPIFKGSPRIADSIGQPSVMSCNRISHENPENFIFLLQKLRPSGGMIRPPMPCLLRSGVLMRFLFLAIPRGGTDIILKRIRAFPEIMNLGNGSCHLPQSEHRAKCGSQIPNALQMVLQWFHAFRTHRIQMGYSHLKR